jgi:excisionase family DNA binding protein
MNNTCYECSEVHENVYQTDRGPLCAECLHEYACELEAEREVLRKRSNAQFAQPAPRVTLNKDQPPMRLKDVADILGCARVTLWRLVKSGALPYIKIGSAKRYRIQDVEAILNQTHRG